MGTEDKLRLIERVLGVEMDTLSLDAPLEDISQWDSLNILNLQIELIAECPDISFDQLHECRTVGEICRLF